jgi:hypothetical protein
MLPSLATSHLRIQAVEKVSHMKGALLHVISASKKHVTTIVLNHIQVIGDVFGNGIHIRILGNVVGDGMRHGHVRVAQLGVLGDVVGGPGGLRHALVRLAQLWVRGLRVAQLRLLEMQMVAVGSFVGAVPVFRMNTLTHAENHTPKRRPLLL